MPPVPSTLESVCRAEAVKPLACRALGTTACGCMLIVTGRFTVVTSIRARTPRSQWVTGRASTPYGIHRSKQRMSDRRGAFRPQRAARVLRIASPATNSRGVARPDPSDQ